MHGIRDGAAATLLADGRVLVAGGAEPWSEKRQVPTWELFDPKTGVFANGGRIPGETWPSEMLRLRDGRVLLLPGGTDRALLFDPKRGTWSRAGRTVRGYDYDTAVLLKDGRVLVTGGEDLYFRNGPPGGYIRDSELFDPRTGRFTVTGSMHAARSGAAAALLPDGRVLIAGGNIGIGEAEINVMFDSAEIYDPKTGRFSGAHPVTQQASDQVAVPLADGRVLLAGGYSDGDGGEVYDPRTGRFAGTNAVAVGQSNLVARLPDGRVVGIVDADYAEKADDNAPDVIVPGESTVWDPATGKVSSFGLLNPFITSTATVLRDGRILLVGNETTAVICTP